MPQRAYRSPAQEPATNAAAQPRASRLVAVKRRGPLARSSPVLAEAADVLSDHLRTHLRRLGALLEPHAEQLERRFLARLRTQRYDLRQRTALAAITLGAAARLLLKKPPSAFFEQIEYHGRRLAKLNLPPGDIIAALNEYDQLLTPILRRHWPDEYANVQWVREQLHFCTILTLNNAYYQVREAETQAFYELFRIELESHKLDELLRLFLGTLIQVNQAEAGRIFLLDEETRRFVPVAALERGKPVDVAPVPIRQAQLRRLARPCYLELDRDRTEENTEILLDSGWSGRYASCWSIPVTTGQRVAGVMQFGFARPYEWLPREVELMSAAAERCWMAAEKARLMESLASREEQVRQLAEHMLHVEEVERRRISRELHDEAGQSLLCIRLQLEVLESKLPEEQREWRQQLAEARDLTEHTILEIRRLIAALSPAVLEQLGLCAALRQLLMRFRRVHPCRVKLHLPKHLDLPKKTESIVYRLVQECCNNIGKHSGATRVSVSLTAGEGKLKLCVEDNGVGFCVEQAFARRDSFGLSGMRERVAVMGGQFEVQSRRAERHAKSKHGTAIRIELPVRPEPPLT